MAGCTRRYVHTWVSCGQLCAGHGISVAKMAVVESSAPMAPRGHDDRRQPRRRGRPGRGARAGPGMPFTTQIADPAGEGDGSTMETSSRASTSTTGGRRCRGARRAERRASVTYSGYNKNAGGNRQSGSSRCSRACPASCCARTARLATARSSRPTTPSSRGTLAASRRPPTTMAVRRAARALRPPRVARISDPAPACRRLRAHCVIRVYRSFFT